MKPLLEFQLNGSFNLVEAAIEGMTDEEWISRAHSDANLMGFTMWHCLRTVDWTINGVAAGTGELADRMQWHDVKVAGAYFGAGVAMDTADSVAMSVNRTKAVEYLDALRHQSVDWLRRLPAADLDRIVDLRQAAGSKDHLQQIVWPEIENLDRIPLWQFIARPAVLHIRVHCGEAMAQLEVLRQRAEPLSCALGEARPHR